MDFYRILKGNPNHDAEGKFAKANAPKGMKTIDAGSVKLYRASSSAELHTSVGGHAALGEGAYFGMSAEAVAGYGGTVREYKATGKLVDVHGDKEYDVLRKEASVESAKRLQKATAANDVPGIIAAASYDVSTHLKAKGFAGVHYRQTDKLNDHHSQVVIFDPSGVKLAK